DVLEITRALQRPAAVVLLGLLPPGLQFPALVLRGSALARRAASGDGGGESVAAREPLAAVCWAWPPVVMDGDRDPRRSAARVCPHGLAVAPRDAPGDIPHPALRRGAMDACERPRRRDRGLMERRDDQLPVRKASGQPRRAGQLLGLLPIQAIRSLWLLESDGRDLPGRHLRNRSRGRLHRQVLFTWRGSVALRRPPQP